MMMNRNETQQRLQAERAAAAAAAALNARFAKFHRIHPRLTSAREGISREIAEARRIVP